MNDPRELFEFPVMDDCPDNNGYGGTWPDPREEEEDVYLENDEIDFE